jgi:hypothetical protein
VKVPCEHQLLGILTDVDKAAGACKPRAKIQLMFLRALSRYAYDGDRLVLRGGLSTHKHVFKSELKSG